MARMRIVPGAAIAALSSVLLSACGTVPGMQPAAPGGAGVLLRAARASPEQSYRTLYRFKGIPDGAVANGGLIAIGTTLYGTTLAGSKNFCAKSCFGKGSKCWEGCGVVFAVDASGNERVVYDFQGDLHGARDGSWPLAGLTPLKETLYGSTSSGGRFGQGTVYALDTLGSERVVYSFKGDADGTADGAYPASAVLAVKNRLYGTTAKGGRTACGGVGCGTIYSLSPGGKRLFLYRFKGAVEGDGAGAYPGLVASDGELYGATYEGGRRGGECGTSGCGTIYEVSLNGKERVLHRFSGGSEGSVPNGLIAVNGTLYGTTLTEGAHNQGTFFSVTRSGALKTIYAFKGKPDAGSPAGTLIYANGNFYGVSQSGGAGGGASAFGLGTVFTIDEQGRESILHSFHGKLDGSLPQAPLYVFDGSLYGTTAYGGSTGCHRNGCGSIFALLP